MYNIYIYIYSILLALNRLHLLSNTKTDCYAKDCRVVYSCILG
jgi:hypothetical protein